MITIDNKKVTDITIGNKVVYRIVDQETDEVIFEKTAPTPTPINNYMYVKNLYNGENTVTITEHVSGGTGSSDLLTYWSKDNGQTWSSFMLDDPNVKTITFTLQAGEFIHFKVPIGGWNNYGSSIPQVKYYRTITCSQDFSVGGDIKSMYMYDYPNIYCDYGFFSIFENSTKLLDASDLDLSNLRLGDYSFQSLFKGCTHLTQAPVLPFQVLTTGCYAQLFDGCTALNEITIYANNNTAANCTYRWLRNVAATGTFNNRGSAVYSTGSSGIPTGWTEDGGFFHIKNRYNGTNTITVKVGQNGTPTSGTYATSVEYSKTGSSWTTLDLSSTGTKTISMSSGETVYFRNSSGYWSWYDNTSNRRYISFYCNQNFDVGGHLSSLVDYTNLNVTIPQGSFHLLFYKSSTEGNMSDKLLSSSKLILPNPGAKAFVGMFNGCINMTDCPTLPTTITANCFDTMFARCRSLTTAPELPSTNLEFACYRQMFYNCISLVAAPALPATTLAEQCYQQMFQDCSSLTTITSFSATTLAERCCFGMFQNCTALTTAPTLPATTLANYCYYGMFLNCTGLITAPALPATELVDHCYQGMFQNCPSLNSVTVYANDNSATDCTLNWLNIVAASGTFHNLGSATYTADSASGIPTGWTEVNV